MTAPKDWHEVEKLTRRVFEAADWRALGEVYFHEGGEQHWADRRKLVVELGVQLARRLALQVPRGGASLWVGAGVAELPVLLAEVTVLGREVLACNLIQDECDLLNAALEAAAPLVQLQQPRANQRRDSPRLDRGDERLKVGVRRVGAGLGRGWRHIER